MKQIHSPHEPAPGELSIFRTNPAFPLPLRKLQNISILLFDEIQARLSIFLTPIQYSWLFPCRLHGLKPPWKRPQPAVNFSDTQRIDCTRLTHSDITDSLISCLSIPAPPLPRASPPLMVGGYGCGLRRRTLEPANFFVHRATADFIAVARASLANTVS